MRTNPSKMPNARTSRHALATVAVAGMCIGGVIAPVSAAIAEAGMLAAQDGANYMVVDRDDAPLRCGDQDVFYAIARLKKGTVLQTAGESGAYTMVVMPERIGALVPATEVEVGTNAKSVTLRVESKLRAPSQLMGLSGSWKQLYVTSLPAGTTLEVIEALNNEAGSVVGYRVKAPKSPSGELPIAYVQTDALRPALNSEVEGNNTDPVPTGNDDGSNTEPAPLPEPETTASTGSETGSASPANESTAVDNSLLQEQVRSTPVEITNTAPVEDNAADPVAQPVRTASEGRIPVSKLEDLEAAFDRARTLPRTELDDALDELRAEFTRTRDEAGDDESLVRALEQRIEWINIRIETRDQRRRIAQALAEYDSGADQTAQAIEAWQQGRAYQLVGRMMTSSVYTGANLPLLYRVQGTDPITGQPRTVGYVAPKPDQDLRHLLGRVVGVLGVKREDASLGLRVVEPERVDLMPE